MAPLEMVNGLVLHGLARTQVALYHEPDEEEGASMAEYGLLLALVAVVAVATLSTVGRNLKTKFQQVAQNLQ